MIKFISKIILAPMLFLILKSSLSAQIQTQKLPLLQPADTLHKTRLWISAATGATIYTGFSMALWNAWYKDEEITNFHTFNDWGEWHNMDKAGHFYTAWVESYNSFNGALWTGMNRKSAIWTAVGVGMGLQTTIEIMDGFTEKWGFSWGDIGFNALGVGLFVTQELIWEEQRFIMKMSYTPPNYPGAPIYSIDGGSSTTLKVRAEGLFGTSYAESFFKDYNGQTIWGSVNVWSFLKNRENSKFPKWLNVAVGYGAQNMYGGFENHWPEQEPEFLLDPNTHPRYRQFYLSFDIDLAKLPVKNRWARFLLGLVNWIKIPAPALEINTLGNVKFHPFYW